MSCCPPNSEPAKPTSPHNGLTVDYGTTRLYVAGPHSAKVGVLAFPDVFGLDSGRTKQDADALGAQGYAVVLVDVMRGDYLDVNSDYMPHIPAFLQRQDFESLINPAIRDGLAYLQKEAAVETVCSYGYCYGAWIGARFSTLPESVVRGHVSFHPNWAIEQMIHGESAVEALANRVTVPQLLLAASNDPPVVREGGAVDKILSGKDGRVGTLSKVTDFPDVKHGWVNRGELSDPAVAQGRDKAWALALEFFQDVTTLV